jgi:O-antigen/teichoic acid export membrane protein
MNDDSLERSTRGMVYHLLTAGITLVLGLIRSILLMRLLLPEDFGILGLALFFATFITPFLSLSIDNALMQTKDISEKELSTHYTLRLILATTVFLICLASSSLMTRIYGKGVVSSFLVLAGIHLLEATYATQNIILRREMRFGALAVLNLLSSLAMTIIAPLFAYLGAGFWSLVVEQAIGPIVRWFGVLFVIRPWNVKIFLCKKEAVNQLRFGSKIVLTHLLGLILDRFDDFWTGTVLGKTPLGYYSRAYELAQYPERVLATPVTYVFYSTYAANQGKSQQLSNAFSLSGNFLSRVGLLFATLLFVIAYEVTDILFGAAWYPIVPVFQMMLIYIMLDPIYVNLSYLFLGIGEPSILNRIRLLQMGIFIPAVIIFSRYWGIMGVAMAANTMMFSGTAVAMVASRRFVHVSYLRMFSWPLVAAFAAGVFGIMFEKIIPIHTTWEGIIAKGSIITLIYLGIVWFSERHMLIKIFKYTVTLIKGNNVQIK